MVPARFCARMAGVLPGFVEKVYGLRLERAQAFVDRSG
jgi:hypothetical protein